MKTIAIKVGESKELARIVRELLVNRGLSDLSPNYEDRIGKSPSYTLYAMFSEKRIAHDQGGYGIDQRLQHFDAATQMGEIIAFLEKKEITVKLNDNYTAEVSADKKTVKVACQTFTREAITELYQALQ